jgi:endonuclease/exonuclease/phosphatase family metal-dependent hydrolase
VTLFNVHATAGGLFRHPESARMERIREQQLVQLSDRALDAPGIAMIVGDLNAGPEASPANFRRLLAEGWHDCATELDGPTWDPTNNLNIEGPHRTSPPQRIDHVLVRASDVTSGRLLPGAARRVLREADVLTRGGRVTPSDHCGLLVELELSS